MSGSIYCIGRNYAEHAAELRNPVPAPTDEPVLFLKSCSSLRQPTQSGQIAYADETFHHEVEIVLRIGSHVNLGSKPGIAAIDGIAVGLDLTRRQKQAELKTKGLPWTLAKSFVGAAVVGTFVPPPQSRREWSDLAISLKVNGESRQNGRASDMIFSPPFLVDWLASSHQLEPGDLIFTGTPAGVGPLRRGDEFVMELFQGTSLLVSESGVL